MGMSSSQARLLNLTSRMHQIEYKAAKIEAEKLQMANESNRVYEEYLEALDAQTININMLAADATITNTPLTADMIYNYGELRDQYALVTTDDKTLISSTLHNQYNNTNSLLDFLSGLGLNDTYQQTIHHSEPNNAYQAAVQNYNNDHATWTTNAQNYANYEQALANYNANHATWAANNAAYTQYQADLAAYNTEHANWVADSVAYAQYQQDLARYNTEHAAWENSANNYNDYVTAHAQWATDHADWVNRNNAYNTYLSQKAVHDQWVIDKAAYDQYLVDKAAYDAWEAQNPEYVKGDPVQPWWETDNIDDSYAHDFLLASTYCYNNAKNDLNKSCYGHVLTGLIDYSESNEGSSFNYTTSNGKNFSNYCGLGGCGVGSITNYNGESETNKSVFTRLSEIVNTGVYVKVDGLTCNVNDSSTDYEKLLSKFNTDGTVKSLKQWCIDLLYITSHSSITGYPGDDVFCSTIDDIQNTLSGSMLKFNEPVYSQAVTDWENRGIPEPTPVTDPGAEPPLTVAPAPGAEPVEPVYVAAPATEPTEPTPVAAPGAEPVAPTPVANPGAEPTRPTAVTDPGAEPKLDDYINGINPTNEWNEVVTHATFKDKALTQWYINVWCKMEGLNETPMLSEKIVHDDATNTNKVLYSVQDKNKSITTYGTNPFSNTTENDNYIVIDDAKLSDNNWISNTVQDGMVMIQVWDKLQGGFVDTSVATNTNLSNVDNKTMLKKAEAKYEADMLKIDKKDRKYDTDLAAFDAERNAIKQEMETLKTVAKENVERTFKLFS